MGASGPSPTFGSSCASCLKKFTVHFRHDEKNYDGSYGFDWLRFEYIKPSIKNENPLYYKDNAKGIKIYNGDEKVLRATYTNDQKKYIKPFGANYVPAWLAYIGGGSVYLDLELTPLAPDKEISTINDGSIIKLVPTNKKVKIFPNEFSLIDLLKNKKERIIDRVKNQKQVFYQNKNVIKITYDQGDLENHEEVEVFLIKGKNSEKVGKLMLYRNKIIPKLRLKFIYVKHGKDIFLPPKDTMYQLECKFFSQTLIKPILECEETFNLNDYKSDPQIQKLIIALNSENPIKSVIFKITDEVLAAYVRLKNKGKALMDDEKMTYVFFTTKISTEMQGHAKRNIFGNDCFIFKSSRVIDVIAHELGHSLNLPHTFTNDDEPRNIKFKKELTDNIMDYSNSHKTFNKFQWDIMLKDKSLTWGK